LFSQILNLKIRVQTILLYFVCVYYSYIITIIIINKHTLSYYNQKKVYKLKIKYITKVVDDYLK